MRAKILFSSQIAATVIMSLIYPARSRAQDVRTPEISNRHFTKLVSDIGTDLNSFFLTHSSGDAQNEAPQVTEIPQNIFYWELVGNAGLTSINYERYFRNNFGIQIGYGFSPTEDTALLKSDFPKNAPVWLVLLKYLYPIIPRKTWYATVGIGIVGLTHPNYEDIWWQKGYSSLPTSSFGIRYLPFDWGFTGGLTLVQFYLYRSYGVQWLIGLSVGLAF